MEHYYSKQYGVPVGGQLNFWEPWSCRDNPPPPPFGFIFCCVLVVSSGEVKKLDHAAIAGLCSL